eukprot:gene11191-23378_t
MKSRSDHQGDWNKGQMIVADYRCTLYDSNGEGIVEIIKIFESTMISVQHKYIIIKTPGQSRDLLEISDEIERLSFIANVKYMTELAKKNVHDQYVAHEVPLTPCTIQKLRNSHQEALERIDAKYFSGSSDSYSGSGSAISDTATHIDKENVTMNANNRLYQRQPSEVSRSFKELTSVAQNSFSEKETDFKLSNPSHKKTINSDNTRSFRSDNHQSSLVNNNELDFSPSANIRSEKSSTVNRYDNYLNSHSNESTCHESNFHSVKALHAIDVESPLSLVSNTPILKELSSLEVLQEMRAVDDIICKHERYIKTKIKHKVKEKDQLYTSTTTTSNGPVPVPVPIAPNHNQNHKQNPNHKPEYCEYSESSYSDGFIPTNNDYDLNPNKSLPYYDFIFFEITGDTINFKDMSELSPLKVFNVLLSIYALVSVIMLYCSFQVANGSIAAFNTILIAALCPLYVFISYNLLNYKPSEIALGFISGVSFMMAFFLFMNSVYWNEKSKCAYQQNYRNIYGHSCNNPTAMRSLSGICDFLALTQIVSTFLCIRYKYSMLPPNAPRDIMKPFSIQI